MRNQIDKACDTTLDPVHRRQARTASTPKGRPMIFLGLILLAAGYIAHVPFLWVLGGLITAGAALHLVGAFKTRRPELQECGTCQGKGTYRHYFEAADEAVAADEAAHDSITAMPDSDKWEWRICPCSMPADAERARW